ncbi:hypothetical protein K0651_12795 [Ornithinimicrobium sp. Arc0846-15]|nr:hypothetical protein [Ornithinimicrobium laminariae]
MDVPAMQLLLSHQGMRVLIDGVFGPLTRVSLLFAQRSHSMPDTSFFGLSALLALAFVVVALICAGLGVKSCAECDPKVTSQATDDIPEPVATLMGPWR